jgi:tetratricopeptide (TPR) repeat protein
MRRLLLALVLATVGCSGSCSGGSKPAAPTAKEPYPWALAEADPGGNTPVDEAVREAQRRAKQVQTNHDYVIALGRAWIVKARHSHDAGYYLHAAACAARVLAKEPNNRLAKELMAQVQLSQHNFQEVVRLSEEVLAADPDAVITHGVLSDALFELGRVDEAIAAADKMAVLKPNAASYVRVAYFQWLRGDANAALETSKLAIRAANDPKEPEPRAYALVQAANFFFSRGDYGGADAGYQQALEVLADYPAALVGRGRVAMAQKDPARAAALFEAALAAAPLADTAWRLGDAREAAGDPKAAEAFARAVELGKKDGRTLALFYATKNRQLPDALELAKKELALRPGPYTQDAFAWVALRLGKVDEAKKAIELATASGVKDPLLLFHKGAIALAAGDAKNAKFLLDEALALSPEFDPAGSAEARRLLAALPAAR